MNAKNAVKILSAAACLLAAQAAFAQRVPGPEGAKMELKWPFSLPKITLPAKSPAGGVYVPGPEGKKMELGNTLKKAPQTPKKPAAKPAPKKEGKAAQAKPVPFYLMGREGHMMQLSETVNNLLERRALKAKRKNQQKPKQQKKEKSVIERLSEPGRLQAL